MLFKFVILILRVICFIKLDNVVKERELKKNTLITLT